MNYSPAALLRRLCTGPWAALRALGLGMLVAVVACGGGGGGGTASVGSGGTGSFSVGTITGFGSVIVNGLRYDDGSASVSDEDGARSRSDLKLGMVVKVQGSISSTGTATASSITFDSELLGPVSAVNLGGKTLTIIGQRVLVDNSTIFDTSLPLGFASIQTNQVLEVHGFVNPATNELQASLIELKTNPSKFKISGTVRNLQTSAKTLQIGAETISYAGLSGSNVPSNLADGLLLKVRLSPNAPGTTGTWTATRLATVNEALNDKDEAEVEGLITAFTSATQFSVGSVNVDARSASFPDGTASLVLGARVKAEGRVTNGILVAQKVELESDGKDIELKGAISNVDSSAKTFVVRGVTVSYGGSVRFDNGTAASLVNGVSVEVEGQNLPNSATIGATRIKF
jgi:Domain of unknown function (DUF5666)